MLKSAEVPLNIIFFFNSDTYTANLPAVTEKELH